MFNNRINGALKKPVYFENSWTMFWNMVKIFETFGKIYLNLWLQISQIASLVAHTKTNKLFFFC